MTDKPQRAETGKALTGVMSALFLATGLCGQVVGQQVSGVAQVRTGITDDAVPFYDKGIGLLRSNDNQALLQQALINIDTDITPSLTLNAVANYYPDGDQHLGLSQLQLVYKPLSADKIKWRARMGFFYPRMSLENPDTGWLSPYTYTNSAINSWLGEELRVLGSEVTLYSPGRARRSPWSWEVHAAAFMANDTLGSLLAWRGFALHDRQSLHHDKVYFAPYPTVTGRPGFRGPNWVEPFREVDQRVGFYLGAHLNYLHSSQLRYYYYDNMADPTAINRDRLYGWRTKFHSLAYQHRITDNSRIIAQLLTGSTEMGAGYTGGKLVFADFDAFYLMYSHLLGQHRLSVRFDRFQVQEDDIWPWDQNNSDGHAVTMAWRFTMNKHWQAGAEIVVLTSTAHNRQQLGLPLDLTQQQAQVVLQYRW